MGGRLAAANLHRLVEGGFAKDYFSERAPNLHFADVCDVCGERDASVHLVAFDGEFLQKAGISF